MIKSNPTFYRVPDGLRNTSFHHEARHEAMKHSQQQDVVTLRRHPADQSRKQSPTHKQSSPGW